MPWKNGGGVTTEIAVFSGRCRARRFRLAAEHGDASPATARSRCLPASTARWPCSKARASCSSSRAGPSESVTPASPPAVLRRRPADLGEADLRPGHRSQRDDPARASGRIGWSGWLSTAAAAIADGGDIAIVFLRVGFCGDFGRRGEPGALAARRGNRRCLAARSGERPSRAELVRLRHVPEQGSGRLARHRDAGDATDLLVVEQAAGAQQRGKTAVARGEVVELAGLDDAGRCP